MKFLLKSSKDKGLVRTEFAKAQRITAAELDATKETVPASEAGKPVFSASQLTITKPRTAEDVRRAIAQGRFAEMNLSCPAEPLL